MENPIKIDDLGVPLFLETPMSLLSKWLEKNAFPLLFCDVIRSPVAQLHQPKLFHILRDKSTNSVCPFEFIGALAHWRNLRRSVQSSDPCLYTLRSHVITFTHSVWMRLAKCQNVPSIHILSTSSCKHIWPVRARVAICSFQDEVEGTRNSTGMAKLFCLGVSCFLKVGLI